MVTVMVMVAYYVAHYICVKLHTLSYSFPIHHVTVYSTSLLLVNYYIFYKLSLSLHLISEPIDNSYWFLINILQQLLYASPICVSQKTLSLFTHPVPQGQPSSFSSHSKGTGLPHPIKGEGVVTLVYSHI